MKRSRLGGICHMRTRNAPGPLACPASMLIQYMTLAQSCQSAFIAPNLLNADAFPRPRANAGQRQIRDDQEAALVLSYKFCGCRPRPVVFPQRGLLSLALRVRVAVRRVYKYFVNNVQRPRPARTEGPVNSNVPAFSFLSASPTE